MGGEVGLDEGIEREETELVVANETRENVHHEKTDGELLFGLVMSNEEIINHQSSIITMECRIQNREYI